MKRDYSEHFLMSLNDVVEYVKNETDYFSAEAELSATELSDGNINYVYRVYDVNNGKSLVVKQADKFLRSSGRPLDTHRNKIEMEILKIEGELCSRLVPEIIHYDENMCALVMEDIGDYENLRYGMLKEEIYPTFAEDISEFMARTLIPTTDLVVNRAEKKKRVQLFTNIELCDISEDLVFTEPYYDYKGRNIITKGQEEYVKKALYSNEELKAEVGVLRNNFMNNAQSLIHGDLHSGSIFANKTGIKVIDPEFAFYGPMGYDIGNVIGNMFFAWANKHYTGSKNKEFIPWVEKTIEEIYDLTKVKMLRVYDERVDFPIYNDVFKKKYFVEVMADSLGYAGTEIIRRTVGDSKVKELNDVKDLSIKIPMERSLIELGIKLIKNRYSITEGKEITKVYKNLL